MDSELMDIVNFDIFQTIESLIVFSFGLLIAMFVRRWFGQNRCRVFFIYAWHTFFSLIAIIYTINHVGDGIGYYEWANAMNYDVGFGSRSVVLLAAFFVHVFAFSFVNVSLVFNVIGTVGLLAFDSALQAVVLHRSRWVRNLATCIVFLPSISFWTSILGKDSLAFLAGNLFLWSSINLRSRILLAMFSIVLMLAVRPHVACIMMIALMFAILLGDIYTDRRRIILGILAVTVCFVLIKFGISYALSYSKTEVMSSIDGLIEYVQMREAANMHGTWSIELSSMSLPEKMFAYLFRPALNEVSNIYESAAGVDNILLFSVVLLSIWNFFYSAVTEFHIRKSIFSFCIGLYVILAWVILSVTTANLGVSLRQKWMFVPGLLCILFVYIGSNKNSKTQFSKLKIDS